MREPMVRVWASFSKLSICDLKFVVCCCTRYKTITKQHKCMFAGWCVSAISERAVGLHTITEHHDDHSHEHLPTTAATPEGSNPPANNTPNKDFHSANLNLESNDHLSVNMNPRRPSIARSREQEQSQHTNSKCSTH